MHRSVYSDRTRTWNWKQAIVAAIVVAIPAVTSLLLAAAGTISGAVKTRGGETAADAQVRLVELKRSTRTDEQGTYRFEGIPAGRYHVEVVSPRYGTAVATVMLDDGQSVTADLSIAVDRDPGRGHHLRPRRGTVRPGPPQNAAELNQHLTG